MFSRMFKLPREPQRFDEEFVTSVVDYVSREITPHPPDDLVSEIAKKLGR